jgi:integrase
VPHFPKPFFRADRGLWYVQVAGRQHNLGPDEAEAFRRYHALMADPPAPKKKPKTTPAPAGSLLAVLEKFLDWCREHRSADTFEWYRWRLQLFADAVDKRLTVEQLKPFHLDDWLARHPRWSSGTKHGMCRAVMRALRWAEKRGRIEKSPLAHYEKPRAGRRKVVVSPAEFERLLAFVRNGRFRDLLVVTWETAARPQEALAVEARHVDLAHGRWVFPPDESKGERWPRVVYLTDAAMEITRRLMAEFPTGPLFRNTGGRPWTTDAVNCCFGALRHRLGRAELRRLNLSPSDRTSPHSPRSSSRSGRPRVAASPRRRPKCGRRPGGSSPTGSPRGTPPSTACTTCGTPGWTGR